MIGGINSTTDDEWEKSQRYFQMTRVFNWKDKPSGYMVEVQYIFKTKKKALSFLNKIDKSLITELSFGDAEK